eukprot:2498362-Rhodomonas_salina.1
MRGEERPNLKSWHLRTQFASENQQSQTKESEQKETEKGGKVLQGRTKRGRGRKKLSLGKRSQSPTVCIYSTEFLVKLPVVCHH